jgi:hypothetical protein
METALIEAVKKQLDELMKNVAEDLKGRWDFYRHAAYLKKRGWTEEEFQDYEDPDRNIRATRLRDYYRGYPYKHGFTSTQTLPWTKFSNWMDCYEEMNAWCKSNCRAKFRSDILRVIKCPATANEWELNDIGGGDALFYAFKDSRDYTMFLLRWS